MSGLARPPISDRCSITTGDARGDVLGRWWLVIPYAAATDIPADAFRSAAIRLPRVGVGSTAWPSRMDVPTRATGGAATRASFRNCCGSGSGREVSRRLVSSQPSGTCASTAGVIFSNAGDGSASA